jgi:hypothetical protein
MHTWPRVFVHVAQAGGVLCVGHFGSSAQNTARRAARQSSARRVLMRHHLRQFSRELSHGAHGAVRIQSQRPRRALASSSSSRRSRSGAGGGLLLYSFDTLCRWLAWRMTRSRLCSRSLLVFGVVVLVVSVPASWRDAVRNVSCRHHLQQAKYMSATFATLGRVAFDGTPASVSASDFHGGMRRFCYFE